MPELRDDEIRSSVVKHARQQREVVVLNEDKRRLAACLVEHSFGKAFVDAAVHAPIVGIENGTRESYVAKGPEALIGKAGIVSLFFLFGKPDAAERVFWAVWRNADAIEPVDGLGSASPLPCAIQSPPEARMTGSKAMAIPLAG